MTLEQRLWTACGVFLVLFVAAGFAVAPRLPSRLDVAAVGFRGQYTPGAVALTNSGRGPFLLTFSIAAIILFAFVRVNVWIPIVLLASQTLSQAFVEAIKRVFHRLRPDYWLVGRELGYSYPSGHACTSIVFYGSWMATVLWSPLPRTVSIFLAVIVGLWMLGIDWSRLALGAHYASDVIGGTLFSLAWLAAFWALSVHFHVPLRT